MGRVGWAIVLGVIVVATIWTYIDAKRLGVGRRPALRALGVFIFPVIAFLIYLVDRSMVKRERRI